MLENNPVDALSPGKTQNDQHLTGKKKRKSPKYPRCTLCNKQVRRRFEVFSEETLYKEKVCVVCYPPLLMNNKSARRIPKKSHVINYSK